MRSTLHTLSALFSRLRLSVHHLLEGRDGSVGVRQVLHLAWPIMISMVSFTAMLVTDSIFVARLGTAPLAAIQSSPLPEIGEQ